MSNEIVNNEESEPDTESSKSEQIDEVEENFVEKYENIFKNVYPILSINDIIPYNWYLVSFTITSDTASSSKTLYKYFIGQVIKKLIMSSMQHF